MLKFVKKQTKDLVVSENDKPSEQIPSKYQILENQSSCEKILKFTIYEENTSNDEKHDLTRQYNFHKLS
jgi:hypothetical protein